MQSGEVTCSMCMNLTKDPVCQVKCGHSFCKSCMKHFIEKAIICPVCRKENLFRGNQPVGYMTWRNESFSSLPGYEKFETIVLTFRFDSGIQGIIELILVACRLHVARVNNYVRSILGSDHPNPGEPFCGLVCTSYLPNNPAGQEVCSLLRSAFDAKLIFTIGKCPATGEENNTIFNGIELKTNRSGGPAKYDFAHNTYNLILE